MKRVVIVFSVGSPACEQVTADVRTLAGDRWVVDVVDVRTTEGAGLARRLSITKVPSVVVGASRVPFDRAGALDVRALRAMLAPTERNVPVLVYGSAGRGRDDIGRLIDDVGGEVHPIDCPMALADQFRYRPPALTVVVVSGVSCAVEAAAASAQLFSSSAAVVAVVPWPLQLSPEVAGSFDQVMQRIGPALDRGVATELRRWVQYARRVMRTSGVQHRSGFIDKRGVHES